MGKPNAELFRLLRFVIRYPNEWHIFQGDARPHVMRGASLGFFHVDTLTKKFRLATPEGRNWQADVKQAAANQA
jgi:hypothetical protein